MCRHGNSGCFTVLDFLKAAGNKYDKEGRSREFVCDLLDMKVPQLFAVVSEDQVTGQNQTISADQTAQQMFSCFLHEYIINKALKNGLLGRIDKIMVGGAKVALLCMMIVFISSRTPHSMMMTTFSN